MSTPLPWLALALLLGPQAGFLVAAASVQFADPSARPSRRRILPCMLACLAAALWAAWLQPGLVGLTGALLGWQLVLIGVIDAEHLWLPHRLTIPLGLLGLAEAAAFAPDQLLDRLIGAAAGFAFLALVALAYRRLRGREGLGGGDFRLLGAAGAWVGWIGLPSVLVVGCGAGLLTVGAMALRGRKLGAGDELPFGVFLAVGLWITWLYGPLGWAGL